MRWDTVLLWLLQFLSFSMQLLGGYIFPHIWRFENCMNTGSGKKLYEYRNGKNKCKKGQEKKKTLYHQFCIIWVKSIILFKTTFFSLILSLFVQKKKKGKVGTCAVCWMPAKQGARAMHAAGAGFLGIMISPHPETDLVNEGHWIRGHLQAAKILSSYTEF